MKHLDFFNDIKTHTIQTSYVFSGQEEYVKQSALHSLSDAILDPDTLDFNRSQLDENAGIAECIAACETYPMMSTKRLVVWQSPKFFFSEWSKSEEALIQTFFQSIPDSTCLVLYYKGDLDKRKKGYKFLQKHSTLVDFAPLDDLEAIRWVMGAAKKGGKKISKTTASVLVQKIGTSVLDLNGEMQKLLHLPGEEITDLSTIKTTNIDYNVFQMISKFLNGCTLDGMKMYYSLVASGENRFMILGALSSKFRNLYAAKSLLESGMNRNAVASELGGGYGAKMAINECGKLSWADIQRAVDAFMQADFNIKNGVMPEDAAVEFEEETLPDYPVHVFFTQEGYFKKITPASLRMSGEQKLKEGDAVVVQVESHNTAEAMFFTNKYQVYKCRVGDFEDGKASVIGDYLPARLGMDEGEVPLRMVLTDTYAGFMLFLFENGKAAKVPLASYATKQNRKKLVNAYSDKAPLFWLDGFLEEQEIALQTTGGRMLLVNTAQIAQKTTKNTAGVNVITLKKGQKLASVRRAMEFEIKDEHRYRVRSLPAVGAPLRAEDVAEQISLGE